MVPSMRLTTCCSLYFVSMQRMLVSTIIPSSSSSSLSNLFIDLEMSFPITVMQRSEHGSFLASFLSVIIITSEDPCSDLWCVIGLSITAAGGGGLSAVEGLCAVVYMHIIKFKVSI